MKPILKLRLTCFLLTLACFVPQKGQAQITDRLVLKDKSVLFVMVTKIAKDSLYYTYYGDATKTVHSIAKIEVAEIQAKNSIATIKWEEKFTPIYFDASLGIGLGAVADVNIGYQFNEIHGLGASLIGWLQPSSCCATSANGAGVQWRLTPDESLLIKLELGYVRKAQYGDDGNYRAVYNHQKSNKIYGRGTLALRLKAFTLGLTLVSTTGQINDHYDYSTKQFLNSSPFGVGSLVLSLGVTMFKFVEKKKSTPPQ